MSFEKGKHSFATFTMHIAITCKLLVFNKTECVQAVDGVRCFKRREDNYIPAVYCQEILIYFVCVGSEILLVIMNRSSMEV